MFKIRQRGCLMLTIALVIAPCIVIIMTMGIDLTTEQSLSQRLGECHMRLQYLESMYRARQEDVAILSQYLGLMQDNTLVTNLLNGAGAVLGGALNSSSNNNNNSNSTLTTAAGLVATPSASSVYSSSRISNLLDALSPEVRQALKNSSRTLHTASTRQFAASAMLRLPTVYHLLPHLLDDPASLRPAYIQSKGRSDVSIVLGVPTVKREKQSYLLSTLKNLIENMNEEEQNETLIIVYIGEAELETVQLMAKQIELSFEPYIECGLIDIIAPSASYYPNFDSLHITLNDSLERVKWRSKQNLDFAYLMAYAQSKGTFYVQLEDDILTKRNFITSMRKYAITKSALTKADQPAWFVLDFCQLGFIGKMFKSAELPYLITFIQMFYNDKPVDWLLLYFIESKVCRIDLDQKHCNQEKTKYWLHYRPSLFQHIGTSSSLKGKVQKLKDKQFGQKVPAYYAHPNNPPAVVKSNIAPYKNYLLKRAYRGETYFWGLLPQPGDLVEFRFEKPIRLRRYVFRSGNSEHPSDRFYNTTVEVWPVDASAVSANSYNTTLDGYFIVGAFNAMGVAEGALDPKIGAVRAIRLHVRGDSENWVLLSEIDLQVAGAGKDAIAGANDAELEVKNRTIAGS